MPKLKHISFISNGYLIDKVVNFTKSTVNFIDNKNIKLTIGLSLDGVGKVHDEIRGVPNAFKKAKKTLLSLKNLQKNKIIGGFKPKINIEKLGYQWHLLLLQFQNITDQRKKEFIDFCKQHKKVYQHQN